MFLLEGIDYHKEKPHHEFGGVFETITLFIRILDYGHKIISHKF